MNNILKNSFLLFSRHKEYISSIVIAPVMMLLIFSFILSFQTKVNIAVINLDNREFGKMIEEAIDDMDFIKPISISLEDVESYIINDKIDLAIIIEENASTMDFETTKPIRIVKSENSNLAGYIEQILTIKIGNHNSKNLQQVSIFQNEVPPKGIPLMNSLGLTIFKMLGASSLLAGLIITEKHNGIRNRIFMSKTGILTYLAGRGIIFFIHLLLFSTVYFITAKLFHFDFSMKHPVMILIIFIVLGIFTTAYGLLVSSFANNDNAVWSFSVLILLPTSILSGALFPFEAMPKALQTVGTIFPQRWITIAFEVLQRSGAITDILIPLLGILILSILFFGIASHRLTKRL